MSRAGRLHIALTPAAVRCQVQVHAHWPRPAQRLFIGKPVDYMLATVPLLFNICRGAQGVAAVRAVEAALNVTRRPATEVARDTWVAAEALHEHLWKLLVDLTAGLGIARQERLLAAAAQALQSTIDRSRNGECGRLGGRATAAAKWPQAALASLRRPLFGDDASGDGTAPCPRSLAGKMLRAAASLDWPTPQIAATSQASADAGGPLQRMAAHPWVARSRGKALSERLAALLAETEQLLAGRIDVLQGQKARVNLALGAGLAVVETARGRLRYRIDLRRPLRAGDTPVAGLDICAPTDANFRPQGSAAQLLASVPAERQRLRARADLLIKLVDPCIGYQLRIDAGVQTKEACHA